jgi:hypothetical protein
MRTTLFGAGPDLRTASVAELPAAQVDLVPTILHLKGIGVPAAVEGRVLHEALRAAGEETTARPVDGGARTLTTQTSDGRYRASVRVSTVGAHRYLDEGGRID